MSSVLEIFLIDYCEETELCYVEAQVEDAALLSGATRYDPEAWTSGRCFTEFYWTQTIDQPFEKPTDKAILSYLEGITPDWTLVPFE